MKLFSLLAALAVVALPALAQPSDSPGDPFIWLEEVESDEALAWVEKQNAATVAELEEHPAYDEVFERSLAIITSDDRIAYPSIRGDYVYNFWTDDEHERGLWRRTTLDSYATDEPDWETVLDIDALAEEEGVNWAFKGSSCLPPDYTRCLVRLSRGGADAVEVREFDTETLEFIDEGFFLPEAKTAAAWMDENTLLISTDFGEGSLTTSGYPRVVKRWTRDTPLADAETVFEGETSDVGAWAASFYDEGEIIPLVAHRPSFFEGSYYVIRDGETVRLDLPLDADPFLLNGQLVVYLRSEYDAGDRTLPVGALVATDFEAFLDGARDFAVVIAPTERQTIDGYASTDNYLLVNVLNNVVGELHRFAFDGEAWTSERVEAPDLGSVNVVSAGDESDRFFFTYSSYLQPSTLYLADEDGTVEAMKQLPALFDADGLAVEQYEATSADGTQIPYFVVHAEDAAMDGSNPTLLYGYGGFEVSLTPGYGALTGANWLEHGGVYVVANIRGGGEFGPGWHRAAQRENRQRAFDDFIAVAEDLIERGITSPDHLGIRGGSNGGLLVGAVAMQRPDLFGAVVSAVPLLDMRRYHTLLAGASWMAEYGNPDDPDDWAFISQYSPYQNIREDADYPRILFTTTTRDDRVHPGHARKMAARMAEMGHPIYYFENTEGGHGAGVTPEQQAKMQAITYTYLLKELE